MLLYKDFLNHCWTLIYYIGDDRHEHQLSFFWPEQEVERWAGHHKQLMRNEKINILLTGDKKESKMSGNKRRRCRPN